MDNVSVKRKTYILLETAIVYGAIYLVLISSFTIIGRRLTAARGVDYDYLVYRPIDFLIPYVPEFVYLYKSLWAFPLIFAAVWFVKVPPNRSLIRRIFVMYLCLYGISAFCWITIPVSCYAIFPTIEELTSTHAGLVLQDHKAIGTMWNAFPSFHCVSIWMLFRLAQRHIPIKAFVWFIGLLGLGIMASTLFVKVHYVVDIVAGVALAEIAVRYFCDSQHARRLFSKTSHVLFAALYILVFVVTSIILSTNPNEKDFQQMILRSPGDPTNSINVNDPG